MSAAGEAGTPTPGQSALAEAWEAQAEYCATQAARYREDKLTRDQARVYTAREVSLRECARELRNAIGAAAPAAVTAATPGQAARDVVAAQEPQPAPVGTAWRLLDEARGALAATKLVLQETSRESSQRGAEAERLRGHIASLLALFGRTSSGWTARLSGVNLARSYAKSQLPLPDDLKHLEGQ